MSSAVSNPRPRGVVSVLAAVLFFIGAALAVLAFPASAAGGIPSGFAPAQVPMDLVNIPGKPASQNYNPAAPRFSASATRSVQYIPALQSGGGHSDMIVAQADALYTVSLPRNFNYGGRLLSDIRIAQARELPVTLSETPIKNTVGVTLEEIEKYCEKFLQLNSADSVLSIFRKLEQCQAVEERVAQCDFQCDSQNLLHEEQAACQKWSEEFSEKHKGDAWSECFFGIVFGRMVDALNRN